MSGLTCKDAERVVAADTRFAEAFRADPARFARLFGLSIERVGVVASIAVALTLTDALRIASADPAFASELARRPEAFAEPFGLRPDQMEALRSGPACQGNHACDQPPPPQPYIRPGGAQPYVQQPGAAQPYTQSGSAQPYVRPGGAQPYVRPGEAQPYVVPGGAQPYVRPGGAQPYIASGGAQPYSAQEKLEATAPDDLVFDVPLNLTKLSPFITSVAVDCTLTIGSAPVGLMKRTEAAVSNGQAVGSLQVVFPTSQTAGFKLGEVVSYECVLTGLSAEPRASGWGAFDPKRGAAFTVSPVPKPIIGTLTW